jgi:hypothetical protein
MLTTITPRLVPALVLLVAMNAALSADRAAFSQQPCGWILWEERYSDLAAEDKRTFSIDDAFDTRADCVKKAETRRKEFWDGMSKANSNTTTVKQTERGVLVVDKADNGSTKAWGVGYLCLPGGTNPR